MYLFSKKYILTNKSTKTKIKTGRDIALFTFGRFPFFHFETNVLPSVSLSKFGFETSSFKNLFLY